MAATAERVEECLARHAVEAGLTGGVDVGQEHDVGVVERFQEVAEEIPRARVAVGLERDDQPSREPLARGVQRGADLFGMMAVVVDHEHPTLLALHLEAAMDAAELLESAAGTAEGDLELRRRRERRQGVERVMPSGHVQPHRPDLPSVAPDLEGRLQSLHPELARLPVGLGRRTVGDEALADLRQEGPHVHVVDAQDREAIERHAMDELQVRLTHPLHVAVEIEVLAVDVRHHGNDRGEKEEGPVALVGLGDQELRLAEPDVRAERAELAADDHGRIPPGLVQDGADERCGGRLPMAPRDRDAVLHPHQLGQHLGPGNDRDLELPPASDLGIREGHRRRDDQHVDAGRDVRRVVGAEVDPRSQAAEAPRRLAVDQVGARDGVPEGEQHLGDAAHTDPADTDEVYPALSPVHRRRPMRAEPRPPAPIDHAAPELHHVRIRLQKHGGAVQGVAATFVRIRAFPAPIPPPGSGRAALPGLARARFSGRGAC